MFVDGDLHVDFDRREVRAAGEDVGLTPIEFKLLAALVRHAGQVMSADQLLRLAWDDASGSASDRVKFSVHRLRRKLGWEDLDRARRIEAVRGFGYRYRPVEPTSTDPAQPAVAAGPIIRPGPISRPSLTSPAEPGIAGMPGPPGT